MGVFAPIFSSLLILVESFLAFLPLFVFVTINVLVLGVFFGGALSWICTTIGSILVVFLIRSKLHNWFNKKYGDNKIVHKFKDFVDKLSFPNLVLFIAIPFMPSFFINVAIGLSDYPIRKYFLALFIGKLFVILFWGFIGVNLVECISNPILLVKVLVLLLLSYIVARIFSRKFGLDKDV